MKNGLMLLLMGFLLAGMSEIFATAADSSVASFEHAEYLPPKTMGKKSSEHPAKGTLVFDPGKKALDFQDKKGAEVVAIPFDTIKSILYEETSHPRYAEALLISPLFLLSPSKSHFLSIQYSGPTEKGEVVILHLDKKNSMEIVATAEAMTGKKVERTGDK